MLLFLHIAGGVALILFGVRYLRKGLDRLFGPLLSRWIQRLAQSRVRAFMAGLGISILAPSSTTMSILAVQAVQLGHLPARKMLAVMLGANIGMTFMVVLISLQLDQQAPIMILIGVILFLFFKRQDARGIGQIVLSLGLIFAAIGFIRTAAGQFEPGGDFQRLLEIAQQYPIWLAVLAMIMAVALQSSTAVIGLVLGLAAAGQLDVGERGPMALAVPILLGANVGLAISTLVFGWGQIESRRLAIGNILAKAAVAVVLMALLPGVLWMIERALDEMALSQQIALFHTGYNVLVAAAFLPVIEPLYRLVRRLVPKPRRGESSAFTTRYITQRPMEGFSLATGQSMREILRMSEIVRSMLEDAWRAMRERDLQLAEEVQQRDDQVDYLDGRIKRFLSDLAGQDGTTDETGEIMRQLRYLAELETIGDIIDKNLAELVIKRIRHRIGFSQAGWSELEAFYQQVMENMTLGETAFATRDKELARQLLDRKQKLSEQEHALRDRHFNRLKSGSAQTYESSSVHLDVLTHLKRINNCVSHAAFAVLEYGPRRPSSDMPMGD